MNKKYKVTIYVNTLNIQIIEISTGRFPFAFGMLLLPVMM